MPLYAYECPGCTRTTEEHRTIADRHRPATCECGKLAWRGIERPNVNPDYEPYLDENLLPMHSTGQGTWVQSRRHRKELMRELGVGDIG